MSDNPLIVVDRRSDGSWNMKLAGDVTVFAARQLHSAAVEAAGHGADVVVECGEIRSLDFAAAQVLVALQRAVATSGKAFRLAGLSSELASVLALVGLRESPVEADGAFVVRQEAACAGEVS